MKQQRFSSVRRMKRPAIPTNIRSRFAKKDCTRGSRRSFTSRVRALSSAHRVDQVAAVDGARVAGLVVVRALWQGAARAGAAVDVAPPVDRAPWRDAVRVADAVRQAGRARRGQWALRLRRRLMTRCLAALTRRSGTMRAVITSARASRVCLHCRALRVAAAADLAGVAMF